MFSPSRRINKVDNKNKIIVETVQLYRILQKVQNILVEEQFAEHNGENKENREFLNDWMKVKDDLTKRSLISTLFTIDTILKLSNDPDEFLVSCQKAGSDCSLVYEGPNQDVKAWIHPDFLICTSFNLMKGDHIDEATSQGIRNGITFIFLPGTRMINTKPHPNTLMTIPGFDNSLNPSAGTDGIRISIHERSATPNPSLEGIDIPPGVSATIGVVSKEIHRLPMPYSNCTMENMETKLLTEIIMHDMKLPPKNKSRVVESSYRIADCRSTCLQRYGHILGVGSKVSGKSAIFSPLKIALPPPPSFHL